jgi:hypothetical protein
MYGPSSLMASLINIALKEYYNFYNITLAIGLYERLVVLNCVDSRSRLFVCKYFQIHLKPALLITQSITARAAATSAAANYAVLSIGWDDLESKA